MRRLLQRPEAFAKRFCRLLSGKRDGPAAVRAKRVRALAGKSPWAHRERERERERNAPEAQGHFLTVGGSGRGGRARTYDNRFWRPVLYQLSYTPVVAVPLPQPAPLFKSKNNADGEAVTKKGGVSAAPSKLCSNRLNQAMIVATTPAPTVRPPSRMAKRSFSSIAIGTIRWTSMAMLSPGITISVPSGRCTTPVTSVVRK